MAYRLADDEGMATGIRRIAGEELDAAIDDLEGRGPGDRDAAVHDARKRLKKTRSALRLVRPDLGRDVVRRENAALRDAARLLSGVRDAQVLLETLDGLAAAADGAVPRPAVRELRAVLEARREELGAQVLEGDGEAGAREVVRALTAVRERSAAWPLDDEGFGSAARGLRRLHGRGRDAFRATRRGGGDDETWHTWRKRVKDLWYSARILDPVAPAQLGGLVAEADRLSDVLGLHNDLAVLRVALAEHADALGDGHVAALLVALDRRRDALRRASLPLGLRLYAERPRAFAGRLSAYWDARDAQGAADAQWLAPDAAARVREILAARPDADAAARRRMGAELRALGFRPSDLDAALARRRGGLSAEDFDALVERGLVRVG